MRDKASSYPPHHIHHLHLMRLIISMRPHLMRLIISMRPHVMRLIISMLCAASYPSYPSCHDVHYAQLLHRTHSSLPCERVRSLSLSHTLSHHPYTHTLSLSLSLHHALSCAHAPPLLTHPYTPIHTHTLLSLPLPFSRSHRHSHTHVRVLLSCVSHTKDTALSLTRKTHCLVSHTKDTALSLTLAWPLGQS